MTTLNIRMRALQNNFEISKSLAADAQNKRLGAVQICDILTGTRNPTFRSHGN